MSPEGGPKMPEQKKGMPFIRVDMDKATKEDYRQLEELGWTKGRPSTAGEWDFVWGGEGEPGLPETLAEKVIGTMKGKIEYAIPVEKEKE